MKSLAWVVARLTLLSGAASLLFATGVVQAQSLSGDALVKALRQGGYVIVLRHASSPREVPDRQTANADNVNRERQLDEAGRASAIAMGKALRQLNVPVGEVFASPTYRLLKPSALLSFPLHGQSSNWAMAVKA